MMPNTGSEADVPAQRTAEGSALVNGPVQRDAKDSGAAAEAEMDFEASLKALEALVKQMESGELGLEGSLAAFERGVKLTRRCQAALKQAELRVQALTEEGEFKDLDVGTFDDG